MPPCRTPSGQAGLIGFPPDRKYPRCLVLGARRRRAGAGRELAAGLARWWIATGQYSEAGQVLTVGHALARAQQRWRDDPAQWLTFGTILTMSQRILAEVSSPLEPPDQAA